MTTQLIPPDHTASAAPRRISACESVPGESRARREARGRYEAGRGGQRGKALSLNMSSGGLFVLMEGAPALDRVFRVHVPTPVAQAKTLTLAEVWWVRKVRYAVRNSLHFVGLKFLQKEKGRLKEGQCDLKLQWESVRVVSENQGGRVHMRDRVMKFIVWCATLAIALGLGSSLTLSQPRAAPQGEPVALETVESMSSSVAPYSRMRQKPVGKSSLIVTEDYIIGPEDVLEISVWRNQDLSKVVAVRPDGRISLPLIGDVKAVGRTPTQLTVEISSKLKEYKENPSVAIMVREVNSYAIFVLGEVGKPGKYPLKSKTTLLQGLTIAGGFTPGAARNKVVVFRFNENGDGEHRIRASYDDIVLRNGSNQNIELKPGDTIVVPSETMVLLP